MSRLKQIASGWLVLLCALFAGVRAGSFVFDPCRRLDRWGDIESHQAMLTDQAGNQIGSKMEQNIILLLARFESLPVLLNNALFQTYTDDRLSGGFHIVLWAHDRESRALVFKQIADSDLNLAELIPESHKVWNGPGSHHSLALPGSGSREPFTDARARLTRTRSENSLSLLPGSGIPESAGQHDRGLSTREEIL